MDAMSFLRSTAGRTLASAALLLGLLFAAPACDRAQTPAPAPTQAPVPPAASAASTDIHAIFTQKSGTIRVRLATAEAPRLCMGFILLAERGYFNGRRWQDFSPVVRQLGDSPPIFTVPRE